MKSQALRLAFEWSFGSLGLDFSHVTITPFSGNLDVGIVKLKAICFTIFSYRIFHWRYWNTSSWKLSCQKLENGSSSEVPGRNRLIGWQNDREKFADNGTTRWLLKSSEPGFIELSTACVSSWNFVSCVIHSFNNMSSPEDCKALCPKTTIPRYSNLKVQHTNTKSIMEILRM